MLQVRNDKMVPLKSFAKEKIEELYQLCAFPRSLILFLQTSLLEESQYFFFICTRQTLTLFTILILHLHTSRCHHLCRVLCQKFLANQSTLTVFLTDKIFCSLSLRGGACQLIHTPSSGELRLNFLSAGLDALPLR